MQPCSELFGLITSQEIFRASLGGFKGEGVRQADGICHSCCPLHCPALCFALSISFFPQFGLLFPREKELRLLETQAVPQPRWPRSILPDKSPRFQIDRSGMWKKAQWADFPH